MAVVLSTAFQKGRGVFPHRTRPLSPVARFRIAFLVFFVLFCCALAPTARAVTSASIILEAETGRVLYEKNADAQAFPASLTKMMTLYLLFDALERGEVRLSTPMKVSARAAGQPPSKLGLAAGRTITVEQAIKAMIVKSANDIAVVVAEHLGQSEEAFARTMTAKARQLGMSRTTFRNASGLPSSTQVTTARDMATLSVALKRDHPKYYPFFLSQSFKAGGTVVTTHNRFVKTYPGADGLKTGYIQASGFNLAASATRNQTPLVGVVLGGKTAALRDQRMAELMDAGFREAQKNRAPVVASRKGDKTASTTTPEKKAPALPKNETPSHGWGIQIGAFKTQESAEGLVRKAESALASAGKAGTWSSSVVSASTKAGQVYRARIIGLKNAQAAENACSILRPETVDACIVLSPAQTQIANAHTFPQEK